MLIGARSHVPVVSSMTVRHDAALVALLFRGQEHAHGVQGKRQKGKGAYTFCRLIIDLATASDSIRSETSLIQLIRNIDGERVN